MYVDCRQSHCRRRRCRRLWATLSVIIVRTIDEIRRCITCWTHWSETHHLSFTSTNTTCYFFTLFSKQCPLRLSLPLLFGHFFTHWHAQTHIRIHPWHNYWWAPSSHKDYYTNTDWIVLHAYDFRCIIKNKDRIWNNGILINNKNGERRYQKCKRKLNCLVILLTFNVLYQY